MNKLFLLSILFLVSTNLFAFGTCSNKFPSDVSFLPEVEACGGKAAIVVMGKFYTTFSAVVRDCNNDDRDPCNKGPKSCGSNESSPYKAQSIIRAQVKQGEKIRNARLFCMKESGNSEIYKGIVRRITIKLKDPVTKPADVAKICLKSRSVATNPVEIVSVLVSKDISKTGYTSTPCSTQAYLACDTSYAKICPGY